MYQYERLDDTERFKIGNRITWITIIINIALAIVKVGSGILYNSTAMLADGIHTVSDVGSSIGIIIGFFISKKPEDIEHQYGHEKAESIAGFILAIFLTAVGINIGYNAIIRIIQNQVEVPGILTAWIAASSILIKELQYRLCIYGGKKINSNALIADAWHHRSDAFSSIAALIGIVGARMGLTFLDPIAGLIVSIIVIKVGIKLFLDGYNELMDTSIEKEKLKIIIEEINSHKDINHINQIRTRKHGSKVFVDMRLCVNPYLTIIDGHLIVHEVKEVVRSQVLNAKDVLISINPCISEEDNQCANCKHYNNMFID